MVPLDVLRYAVHTKVKKTAFIKSYETNIMICKSNAETLNPSVHKSRILAQKIPVN